MQKMNVNTRLPEMQASLFTPPLSPADSGSSSLSSVSSIRSLDLPVIPDLLVSLFPKAAGRVAKFVREVFVKGAGGEKLNGFVLDLPKGMKPNAKASCVRTVYIDGQGADILHIRETIVALLDLAEGQLSCQAVVIALDKSSPILSSVLHALMYVGGTVVTQTPFELDKRYILVGIDL